MDDNPDNPDNEGNKHRKRDRSTTAMTIQIEILHRKSNMSNKFFPWCINVDVIEEKSDGKNRIQEDSMYLLISTIKDRKLLQNEFDA